MIVKKEGQFVVAIYCSWGVLYLCNLGRTERHFLLTAVPFDKTFREFF